MELFILFQIIILLFSVVIHEVAHGYMAESLGDDTARNAGRLTLNPIPHLDLFGSILLPALLVFSGTPFIIGWAKPVPYNPYKLHKDPKFGPLKVALIGPAVNIFLAIIFGLIMRLALPVLSEFIMMAFGFVVFINILLAVFNLLPIPPLDGSKILTILLPHPYSLMVQQVGLAGIFLVVLFLVFFSGFIFGSTAFLTELIIGPEAWQVFIEVLTTI